MYLFVRLFIAVAITDMGMSDIWSDVAAQLCP